MTRTQLVFTLYLLSNLLFLAGSIIGMMGKDK
jgi:hypothetical protein